MYSLVNGYNFLSIYKTKMIS